MIGPYYFSIMALIMDMVQIGSTNPKGLWTYGPSIRGHIGPRIMNPVFMDRVGAPAQTPTSAGGLDGHSAGQVDFSRADKMGDAFARRLFDDAHFAMGF